MAEGEGKAGAKEDPGKVSRKRRNGGEKMESRKFFPRKTSGSRLGAKQRPWAKARNLFISYR